MRLLDLVASEANGNSAAPRSMSTSSTSSVGATPGGQSLGLLTERELAVAVAIGRGRSNAEISAELFLSVATAKAYVSRMLTRLDLNNRVQVALLVHDADLI